MDEDEITELHERLAFCVRMTGLTGHALDEAISAAFTGSAAATGPWKIIFTIDRPTDLAASFAASGSAFCRIAWNGRDTQFEAIESPPSVVQLADSSRRISSTDCQPE